MAAIWFGEADALSRCSVSIHVSRWRNDLPRRTAVLRLLSNSLESHPISLMHRRGNGCSAHTATTTPRLSILYDGRHGWRQWWLHPAQMQHRVRIAQTAVIVQRNQRRRRIGCI